MRDYSSLSPEEKTLVGNRWLIRNEVYQISIINTPEGFGIKKNEPDNELLLTMPDFEEIIREIQKAYRLDNSPELI